MPLADQLTDIGTESAREDTKTAVAVGCRRILVVDDNADAVATLSDLLEMIGHEVRTAADGEEAICPGARLSPGYHLHGLRDARNRWHRSDAAHPGAAGALRGQDRCRDRLEPCDRSRARPRSRHGRAFDQASSS